MKKNIFKLADKDRESQDSESIPWYSTVDDRSNPAICSKRKSASTV